MQQGFILISIVMPTLNEQSRIEKALKSIRKQTITQEQIEILVIDGGSTDRTKEIAESYGAKIYDNHKVVPEEAKRIGLLKSVGKYIVFMDADEEFIYDDQLKQRIKLFQNNPEVKAILPNCLRTPLDYPSLTRYANGFGDPFSYFVYRFDGEDLIDSLDKHGYKCKKTREKGRIYYLDEDKPTPIGDSGTTTLDFEYLRKHFMNRFDEPSFIAVKFDEVARNSGCYAIIEGDTINHYTSIHFKTYLKKIKFRVVNNLNPANNISGYAARTKANRKLNSRKYLYLLYCLFIPFVVYDSISLTIRKKSFVFMLHFIFVYYVLIQICYYSFLKVIGVNSTNANYGK